MIIKNRYADHPFEIKKGKISIHVTIWEVGVILMKNMYMGTSVENFSFIGKQLRKMQVTD